MLSRRFESAIANEVSLAQRPRRFTISLASLLVCVLVYGTLSTELFGQDNVEEARPLKEKLASFTPYVGVWEIDTEWANGSSLWAKNEYSVGMNGNFFEAVTWTKNEAGKVYQRYRTIWRYNPDKDVIESYGFTYDGSVTVTQSELDATDPKRPIIRSKWRPNPESSFIKQEVQISKNGKTYDWRVWSSPDEKEWTKMMDGVYKRVEK